MQKKIVIALMLVLFAGTFYSAYKNKGVKKDTNSSQKQEETNGKMRIGWQTPWATQGQLVQVMKHTEILKKNNVNAEFVGFAYGAPLNEAALAGNVDVVFTADQPAATLLSKNDEWKIIGRLMYNRVSLYVPAKSDIKTVKQLKGKTVAMPFGAAAQRMALRVEKEAGLDPKVDVKNINLAMNEQAELIKKDTTAKRWGDVDAMAGFDPAPATFEEKGWVRNLNEEKVTSVILMSTKYINDNPDAPVNFLKAFNDTYDYYRNNITQADQWFIEESKLTISNNALAKAASVEPNLKVKDKSEIRISFNEADLEALQSAADFIFDQGLVKNKVIMKNFVDQSYLEKINK